MVTIENLRMVVGIAGQTAQRRYPLIPARHQPEVFLLVASERCLVVVRRGSGHAECGESFGDAHDVIASLRSQLAESTKDYASAKQALLDEIVILREQVSRVGAESATWRSRFDSTDKQLAEAREKLAAAI